MQLWFTTHGNLPRFFLLDPEERVPQGALLLENTVGDFRKVDPDAVADREIELGEARAWFEENEVAIEAVRDAKRARVQDAVPRLEAMAKALEAAVDDELVARELLKLGLQPDLILDVEKGHAFVAELVELVKRSHGAPDPDALRKVFRRHGHKKANRLLRGDETALRSLNQALARLIRQR